MKMNNLSNPSRVILSVAKDLAVAFALFAFAACSDYLEDFQDKYDDGKAFAEISSDSDNGGDDGKSSSSNGGDVGSSDSKLSSSSNGNGNVDSSNSTGSSSSAANDESVHCTGTVIYDYKNPGKLGLDLQFFTNGTATKLPENKQGIELTSNTVKDFAIFTLSKNDLHDVSSWEGLCVEYSSNEDIPFYLADSLENIEQINLPANDHFKEISWADTTSRKISLNGRVSFNKFDAFSFGKSTTQKVVTISRITTIAKVAPGSSSSVAESSSSAFKPCTGTVIYDAKEDPKFNRFGRKFITYVHQEYGSDSSKTSPDGVTAQLSEGSSLIMPLATYPDTMNIEPWGGFCVEYTGSGVLHANVVDESSGNKYILLYKEMPNINGEKSSFTWSWNENKSLMELMEEQNNSDLSDGFSLEKVHSINFTSYSGNSSITIHKITTLKPVDLGLNGVYNGLEPVSECSEGSAQIIYAPVMGDKSYCGTYFYAAYQKDKKAIYNPDKSVLILNMDAEGTTNMYQMNMISALQTTTRSWDGLCIEYEADHPLSWLVTYINNVKNDGEGWEPNSQAQVLLPKTEGIKAYKISWKKFAQLTDNDFVGMINSMRFEHGTADEYYNLDQSYNKDNYQRMVDLKIQKITSYK